MLKKVVLIVLALAGIGAIVRSHHGSSNTATNAPSREATSSISVVGAESFCLPTGIDDAYTGEGHVTFYLVVRNTGSASGRAQVTPVRHYDDGQENDSAMDMTEIDVPAHAVRRVRTSAMSYKAHEHAIISCGVIVDHDDEVALPVH